MKRTGGGVLLYHDVVDDGRTSGFAGAGSEVYKLDARLFDAHLHALRQRFPDGPRALRNNSACLKQAPFMLTFDDGGDSAAAEIADRLERVDWRGIFFVTTSCIGQPGFLNRTQIAALHERGHVIGSHSLTHPLIMSRLPTAQMLCEWKDSAAALSRIIGERVRIASVPGGYTSAKVVETAAEAGIRFLFTSEPSIALSFKYGVQLIGRFAIKNNTRPEEAVALAGASRPTQIRHWLRWNTLKLAKRGLGRGYPWVREALLRQSRTEKTWN